MYTGVWMAVQGGLLVHIDCPSDLAGKKKGGKASQPQADDGVGEAEGTIDAKQPDLLADQAEEGVAGTCPCVCACMACMTRSMVRL